MKANNNNKCVFPLGSGLTGASLTGTVSQSVGAVIGTRTGDQSQPPTAGAYANQLFC